MVDMNEVRALSECIAQEFKAEQIILFGSHAYGTPSPDSDVDLLVVLPFEGKPWRMAAEIRRRTRPRFPLDLLVRSPEQLRLRLDMQDGFMREVMHKGKVLYEARNSRMGRKG